MQVICPNCKAKHDMPEDKIHTGDAKVNCKCGSIFSVKGAEGKYQKNNSLSEKMIAWALTKGLIRRLENGESSQIIYRTYWKKFFNLLTWIFGLIFLVISFYRLIEWPNIIESYILSAISILISILIFPPSAFSLGNNLSSKLTTSRRILLVFLLMCFFPLFENIIDNKKLGAMPPEERARTISLRAQIETEERWGRESRAQAEQIANECEIRKKNDSTIENKRQKEFYDQLSAPKILYKCKDSYFTHAYGANFGSYNRLLEKAYADCGDGNLDIIKKGE